MNRALSETEQQIIAWWAEGKSQGLIAILLGVSVNSVAGRINRMRKAGCDALPARPEGLMIPRQRLPVGNQHSSGQARAPKAPVAKPAAAVVTAAAVAPRPMQRLAHWSFGNVPDAPAAPVLRLPRRPPPTSYHKRCQMIFGDVRPADGGPPVMCGEPSAPSKSWCPACAVRVFRRPALDEAA